jgi:hypothetical protein
MITALIYGYAESEIAIGSFSQNDERDKAAKCEAGSQSNQLHSVVAENAEDAVSIVYSCWRV